MFTIGYNLGVGSLTGVDRIQELEKEREEIMNLFESQINSALEGLPGVDDTSSRPNTPSESVVSSPVSHMGKVRPDTRDSGRSVMSRQTFESKPLSVLGAAKGMAPSIRRKQLRPKTGDVMDGMLAEKTDGISMRIWAIQQKVSEKVH